MREDRRSSRTEHPQCSDEALRNTDRSAFRRSGFALKCAINLHGDHRRAELQIASLRAIRSYVRDVDDLVSLA